MWNRNLSIYPNQSETFLLEYTLSDIFSLAFVQDLCLSTENA